MPAKTYYRDVQDGSLLRRSGLLYEVLWPSGEWAQFEPSYECVLHLEKLTEAQAPEAIERFLAERA